MYIYIYIHIYIYVQMGSHKEQISLAVRDVLALEVDLRALGEQPDVEGREGAQGHALE